MLPKVLDAFSSEIQAMSRILEAGFVHYFFEFRASAISEVHLHVYFQGNILA